MDGQTDGQTDGVTALLDLLSPSATQVKIQLQNKDCSIKDYLGEVECHLSLDPPTKEKKF